MQVWSQSQDDPMEESMTAHSSILTWKILWTEETGELQSMGSQRIGHDWAHTHTHTIYIQHSVRSTCASKEQLMKRTDGGIEGCVLIFSCKNTKITPSCWTTIDMRMWDTTKERYLSPWAKEKPQQDGRRDAITFKIKSHTRQRCLEGTNKTCMHQDPRNGAVTPQETEPDLLWVFECLLRRHRSAMARHRDQGSESSIPGKHGMRYKFSRKRSPLAPL